MIEKKKKNLWHWLEGIDTYKVDDSKIPQEYIDRMPPELFIKNSKQDYLSLIKYSSGIFALFIGYSIYNPKPFIDAYEKSPLFVISLALLPIITIGYFLSQYYNERPIITIDKSGIKHKGELASWYSVDSIELVYHSNNTRSIVVKNKYKDVLTSLNAANLELSEDALLITLKAYQKKFAVN